MKKEVPGKLDPGLSGPVDNWPPGPNCLGPICLELKWMQTYDPCMHVNEHVKVQMVCVCVSAPGSFIFLPLSSSIPDLT